ncbi:precorrin-3B C(17)-methyltransferase [Streptantibioticus silvisoli]|uniref:Precorrin-3B C(17)-methyltransferase n=1 Tax=Streptantibioticus silvisoli TaxID=2705255 RepID=A0ABT6W7A0_9ACTN|nr:precorrin-3B C(17)-methyltransferase [Streptantibioticus silvisoli]MDI5966620.1 precorrin-3B C(17)-methyltransferase [Streptantibioticus silvisoli]
MTTPTRIGVIAVTAAGRRTAEQLRLAWPERVEAIQADSGAQALRDAFGRCDAVVAVMAAGAVVRVLAPLIAAGDKATDPAVLVIDETHRFVVPLLGGHAAGANRLAGEIAALTGAQPVLTTATDAAGLPGLDELGWPAHGDIAGLTRRMLDGEPVTLATDATWPLPSLGPAVTTVTAGAEEAGTADVRPDLAISDRTDADATVVLRPPSLVAGMGASRGVPADEAETLLRDTLRDAGLAIESLAALATADVKADEPGLVELARRLGLPLVTHPADRLAGVTVPNPSEVVRQAVGTPSVAEAAAVLGTGRTPGTLLVPKRAAAMSTVAIARHAPRGRLAVVGLGPGSPQTLTPAARDELRRASVVVGLDQYVDQIRHLLRPGTRILSSGLGQEEERAHTAVARARDGHAVALIGSGDAGVYAMASPALEAADAGIDVVGVPGVTAALAAASVLGAPLGHDHCYLSLSDLHTPWPAIERRLRAVAEADLVLVVYNPRSAKRDWQLDRALELLAEHRPPHTPIGVVRNATRPDQQSWLTTLADADTSRVDMYCLVVVGSSTSRIVGGRMVTPRGYRWMP